MDALKKLNQACHEVGVCDSEALLSAPSIKLLSAPGIKHAAELWKEGSPRKIIVACWDDDLVTSCVVEVKSGKEQCCYTAEKGGPELYYAWQSHLTSPEVGYKIKTIETEDSVV